MSNHYGNNFEVHRRMSLLTPPSYSCMPAMVATALICISEVGHRRETFSRLLRTVICAVHISLSLIHFNSARSVRLGFGTCSICSKRNIIQCHNTYISIRHLNFNKYVLNVYLFRGKEWRVVIRENIC